MASKPYTLDLSDAEPPADAEAISEWDLAEDLLDFCERGYSEVGEAQDLMLGHYS